MVIHFQPRAWALWNWHLKEKHLPTPPGSFSVFKKYKGDRPSQSVRWECVCQLGMSLDFGAYWESCGGRCWEGEWYHLPQFQQRPSNGEGSGSADQLVHPLTLR